MQRYQITWLVQIAQFFSKCVTNSTISVADNCHQCSKQNHKVKTIF